MDIEVKRDLREVVTVCRSGFAAEGDALPYGVDESKILAWHSDADCDQDGYGYWGMCRLRGVFSAMSASTRSLFGVVRWCCEHFA